MKKVTLFLMAVTCIAMTACNDDKKTETTDKKDSMSSATETKAEKNKKTALASAMAINTHDVDVVLKDAAPDGMDLGDGSMPPTKGIDSIKAGMKNFFAAFPDLKGEDFEALSNADGSKVIVLAKWSGTFKNDFMGMKATGKSYAKINDADIFTFDENGKITSHANVQSNMTYMNAVAAMMPK
jgi:predicted ester cyclase